MEYCANGGLQLGWTGDLPGIPLQKTPSLDRSVHLEVDRCAVAHADSGRPCGLVGASLAPARARSRKKETHRE